MGTKIVSDAEAIGPDKGVLYVAYTGASTVSGATVLQGALSRDNGTTWASVTWRGSADIGKLSNGARVLCGSAVLTGHKGMQLRARVIRPPLGKAKVTHMLYGKMPTLPAGG